MAEPERPCDLFIVGGGINGAAIARDAAGRGLRVMLAEKDDYAAATSSASSKLIHGGLRYLEQYEFKLVREALLEREIMLKLAPHLTRPLTFLMPVREDTKRPVWMLRAGLMLYDWLSGSKRLERSGSLSRDEIASLPHLRKQAIKAILHYPDCQVDDARLVLALLLDARSRGADIANRRAVTGITPQPNGYRLRYTEGGRLREIDARFIVNTAGPWANDIVDMASIGGVANGDLPRKPLKLVRGSHIILKMPQPALQRAFIMQNHDGRVVFAIPWLNAEYLMIGTTDARHDAGPSQVECTPPERDYLLECYNRYFQHPDGAARSTDIVWQWAGIRVLVDERERDPSKLTRSAQILTQRQGNGGFITVYGGKLTSHRRLAEKIMDQLTRLGAAPGPSWTADSPLHGGSLGRDALLVLADRGPEIIPHATRRRWVFTYGDQAKTLFSVISANPALGRPDIGGVCEAELRHAADYEDARMAEDFLFRRTKLGINLAPPMRARIETWFARRK